MRHARWLWWLAWLAGMLPTVAARAALATQTAASRTAVFALIVGNNQSPDSADAPLRYADDDAVRWAGLFDQIPATHLALLTLMDESTQRRYPQWVAKAIAPSHAALTAQLRSLFDAMEQTRKTPGTRVAFYFIFSGHGGIGARHEGYLYVGNDRFSRADLYHEVLAHSPAHVNHLIIDACQAYYLVHAKGVPANEAPGHWTQPLAAYLSEEQLSHHPNTGVLLSATADQRTHEWALFEAGIFTHQILSALTGAADIDGDAVLRYDEVEAFVQAANASIEQPRARLRVLAAPPAQNLREPLFDGAWRANAHRLELAQSVSGRFWLESEQGLRYADWHQSGEQPVQLHLAPATGYTLHGPRGEIALQSDGAAQIGPDATFGQTRLAQRGAIEHEYLLKMFQTPYGPAFYRGFAAAKRQQGDTLMLEDTAEPGRTRFWTWSKWTATGLAGALALSGALCGWQAAEQAADYNRIFAREGRFDQGLRTSMKRWRDASTGLFISSGALAAYAVAAFIVDALQPTRASSTPQLTDRRWHFAPVFDTRSGFAFSWGRSF